MDNKTLHIDTLYLSYDCDLSAYKNACEIIAEKTLLYYRDGRQYYDFGYARVGWLDWDIAERSGNYPFVIEYNFNYLYQADLINKWEKIKLPFSLNFNMYLVKRLDYNITFQSDRNILNSIFVSPHFRKGSNWWGTNRDTETVNLGLRKTGKTFRIYNKTKELSDKKDFIKADMLRDKFGSLDNLYSLEVELLRKYIISRVDTLGSLSDFEEILDIARTLLSSIKFCESNDKNLALIKSKNYNKVIFETIDSFVGEIEFKEVKKYKKSKLNLVLAIDKMLQQYNEYEGEVLTYSDLGREIGYIEAKKLINKKD